MLGFAPRTLGELDDDRIPEALRNIPLPAEFDHHDPGFDPSDWGFAGRA